MGRSHQLRRAIRIGTFVAGLVLVLGVPAVALAANTATFSGAAPQPSSFTAAAKPTVTVTVYDRYGVRGSGAYSMTLDGHAVRPSISYTSGTTRFKLTYKVASTLSNASHTVAVKVKDLSGRTSTYSWHFSVDTVPPMTINSAPPQFDTQTGLLTLTAADAGSGVAETYYKLDHGTQTLYNFPILGSGEPPSFSFTIGTHTLEYWSVDKAGNVETHHVVTFVVQQHHDLPIAAADQSCIAVGCHGGPAGSVAATGDVMGIHAPLAALNPSDTLAGCPCHELNVPATTNCITCHPSTDTTYIAKHVTHDAVVSANEGSATLDCLGTGCHGGSGATVLTIHNSNCALCHNPSGAASIPTATIDAVVAAGVANGGGQNCEDCHGDIAPHSQNPTVAADHAFTSGGCTGSECHSSDVSVIHTSWINPPGCLACHAPTATPSTDCLECHSTIHGNEGTAHASSLPAGCTANGCHSTNLETEHTNRGIACTDCHASTDARVIAAFTNHDTDCIACHSGTGSDANLNSNYHGYEFLNPGNASGHNVEGNIIGGKSAFDGSQGVLLKTTIGTTVTNTWATPTVNVFKPGATDDNGHQLGWNSVVTCQDCHDVTDGIQATGPHGSTQSWAIDPAYPYPYTLAVNSHLTSSGIVARISTSTVYGTQINAAAGETAAQAQAREASAAGLADASTANTQYAVICAKCHQLFDLADAFSGPGGVLNGAPGTHGDNYNINTGVNNDSNTAHASHHFDLNNGAADCVNCHVAIPHGWTRPRLLVNGVGTPTTDPSLAATATYNAVIGGTETTVTWTSDLAPYWAGRGVSLTSTSTLNALGMGPLDASDQHSLNASGGVLWTESDCIACGEHFGVPADGAKLK